jgi:hypothetical protein
MLYFSAMEDEIGVIPKDSEVTMHVERILGIGNDVAESVAVASSTVSS